MASAKFTVDNLYVYFYLKSDVEAICYVCCTVFAPWRQVNKQQLACVKVHAAHNEHFGLISEKARQTVIRAHVVLGLWIP